MRTFVALAALLAAWGIAQAQGGPNHPDMKTIHTLFEDATKLRRTVKNLPNGIETRTTSQDPRLVALLQEHVAAMKGRLERRQPIRQWDPLFAALFQHARQITMTVANTPEGVTVTETSDDPYVVALLQAHAKAVSGFVRDGIDGMHVRHPAPPRPGAPQKAATSGKTAAFAGKGDGVKTCPVTGEPVDAALATLWRGKTVRFCCASCKTAFEKSPETFLKRP